MTIKPSQLTDVSYLTYEGVADLLEVGVCLDPKSQCQRYALTQHTRGYVGADCVVHWRNRALTRRGLWNFLKLVARTRAQLEGLEVELDYRAAQTAYHLGLIVQVRFPREFAADDRAKVRAGLARQGFLLDRETKETIERWARETPG